MIAEMVKHGAPVNAEAKNGHTPLSLAAKSNDTESIKLLLDAGALPNENALVRCISSRNIENIKLLLDAGQPAREYMLAYVESADAREVRDLLQKDLIDRKKNDLHRATTTVRDMTVSKPVRLKPPQNKP
jgi:ankyrin repeat protein